MTTKSIRITIDLPNKEHKKLKTAATLLGVSMKEFVIDSLHETFKSRTYNKKTLKAIREAEEGNLKEFDSLEDMFEDLGI
ncbi:MAG: hypothetical protein ACFFG0_29885 [Candidatus Thorarchaeota archaeon]